MPVVVRSPAHNVYAASYRFSSSDANTNQWPWLRNPPPSKEVLCDVCAHLDFHWLFENALYDYSATDGINTAHLSDGIRLGGYSELFDRSSCPFCRLVVHSLISGADYDMLSEKDQWGLRDVYMVNFAYSSSGIAMSASSKPGGYAMRLGIQLKSINEDDSILSFGARTISIQRVGEQKQIPYIGRPLSSNQTELTARIRGWVQPCRNDRYLFVSPSQDMDPLRLKVKIRLIDTERRCIIGPVDPSELDYAALSYTWGNIDPLVLGRQNLATLTLEGSLRKLQDRIPATILHAIDLCSSIGEHYLWVDSLCIVQDTHDKHDQIQAMDDIYRLASLTIVAAAGSDGNAGLPGISNSRQNEQRVSCIAGINMANVLPHLENSLAHSVWHSRGWTFQEALLSKRKIIFTSDQTYYHCYHGEASEDTDCDVHSSVSSQEDGSKLASADIPLRLNLDNVSNWAVYRTVAAEYCKRELSYESDVVNAFAGIASYLSQRLFGGSPFLAGIPECCLEVGLLWQPTGRLRRRKDSNTSETIFPSWSWAGWYGPMEYVDTLDFDNLFERTISRIGFPTVRPDSHEPARVLYQHPSERVSHLETVFGTGCSMWQRKVSDSMDEVYYVTSDQPHRWFAFPFPQRAHIPQSLFNHLDGKMPIKADVAILKLTGEHANLWYSSDVCNDEDHQMCRLQVFDSQDRKAGTVVMDGATFDATDFSYAFFTFIKISQTTLAPGEDDPAWDKATKTYMGLPGAPAVNPRPLLDAEEEEFDQTVYDPNVCWPLYNVLVVSKANEAAERIAVGQVHIHAFDAANPTRETLLLG